MLYAMLVFSLRQTMLLLFALLPLCIHWLVLSRAGASRWFSVVKVQTRCLVVIFMFTKDLHQKLSTKKQCVSSLSCTCTIVFELTRVFLHGEWKDVFLSLIKSSWILL